MNEDKTYTVPGATRAGELPAPRNRLNEGERDGCDGNGGVWNRSDRHGGSGESAAHTDRCNSVPPWRYPSVASYRDPPLFDDPAENRYNGPYQ